MSVALQDHPEEYTFDEKSGLYFESEFGYYYDTKTKLHYDGFQRCYLKWNPSTKQFDAAEAPPQKAPAKENQSTIDPAAPTAVPATPTPWKKLKDEATGATYVLCRVFVSLSVSVCFSLSILLAPIASIHLPSCPSTRPRHRYYYNSETGESQWTAPPGFAEAAASGSTPAGDEEPATKASKIGPRGKRKTVVKMKMKLNKKLGGMGLGGKGKAASTIFAASDEPDELTPEMQEAVRQQAHRAKVGVHLKTACATACVVTDIEITL